MIYIFLQVLSRVKRLYRVFTEILTSVPSLSSVSPNPRTSLAAREVSILTLKAKAVTGQAMSSVRERFLCKTLK